MLINFIKSMVNYVRLEEKLIQTLKQADIKFPHLKSDLSYTEQARNVIRGYKKSGMINKNYEFVPPIIA